MTMIQIGRRSVEKDRFIEAVQKAERLREVVEILGFNSTVGSTKEIIRERIKELGLNTDHFKGQYNKTENFYKINKSKDYNISKGNKLYIDIMEQKIDPKSWSTYKCSLGNFLEYIGTQDFATVTPLQMERFCGSKKNSLAHIRSMMITAVKENVNNAVDKVSKEMLVWLI
jgi:hypothetical protein